VSRFKALVSVEGLARLNVVHQHWSHGSSVERQADTDHGYDTTFAHPVLEVGGTHNERDYAWHLWISQKGSEFSSDATRMLEQERDTSIAQEALLVLMRDDYRQANTATDLEDQPLAPAMLSQPGTCRISYFRPGQRRSYRN
jgi:hypothetical protein